MKKSFCLYFLLLSHCVLAQLGPLWSQRMATTVMATYPDSLAYQDSQATHWDDETGLVLQAIEQVWYRTGDSRYFNYIQKHIDRFVKDDGSIQTYRLDKYDLNGITPGRLLLMLCQQSLPNRAKYRKAADTLRKQLTGQPCTKEGGFWNKNQYPDQMWLDGLYKAEPFYAEYTRLFDRDDNAFNNVINQFVWMEQHVRDAKTGLLYPGLDKRRRQTSPNFSSRAMGWYAMALVDVLDYIPATHPRRNELVRILQRLMPAIVKYQDSASGCWYQVTNRRGGQGNYLEASGTGMFVYALTKGVRMGYLPASMMTSAKKGYTGMLNQFISTDLSLPGHSGLVHLKKTELTSRAGGNPGQDTSHADYLSEPLRQDDLKGAGSFILASVEIERADDAFAGKLKTVGVDTYFNHEFRKSTDQADESGGLEPFHYTWEDRMHSGFWFWGNTFRDLGAKTVSVPTAPTAALLKPVDVYILVDPDTPKETTAPNYVKQTDIRAISDWVKAGGVLVLMANDTANCEHVHFNQLAAQFGLQFRPENVNKVPNDQFEQGSITIPVGNSIFPHARAVFIKELSPLRVEPPAQAVIRKNNDVIMAVANWGRGTVFAVGDPWLYNEYIDGRRIPAVYENFNAGKDLAVWLLKQVAAKPAQNDGHSKVSATRRH